MPVVRNLLRMPLLTGGLGAVGSLLSLWVSESQDNTHLWLLGRSGRGSWDPLSVGQSQVTLARSDVSVMEETRFIVGAADRQMPLQASFASLLKLQ